MAVEWEGVRFRLPPKRLFYTFILLKVTTKATYIPPAILINLPDPLNFLVRSLTHEFYVQNWSWSKKGGMQKGGLVYWVSKFFWSWSKKREMRKGGWVQKGWVRTVLHLGAKKTFWALRACTHLKKILNTPLSVTMVTAVCWPMHKPVPKLVIIDRDMNQGHNST